MVVSQISLNHSSSTPVKINLFGVMEVSKGKKFVMFNEGPNVTEKSVATATQDLIRLTLSLEYISHSTIIFFIINQ